MKQCACFCCYLLKTILCNAFVLKILIFIIFSYAYNVPLGPEEQSPLFQKVLSLSLNTSNHATKSCRFLMDSELLMFFNS